jgi:uncharacterized protein YqjF (DUF2071 family)
MYRNALGKGYVGLVLTLTVIAVGVYVGVTVFPIYYNVREFEGALMNEGVKAGARFYSDEAISKDVILLAKGFDIPLKREDIKIKRFGDNIELTVECDLPIRFGLVDYTYNWHFVAKSRNLVGIL